MIDTKQRAKYILEEYANCYSDVDVEELAKNLDEIKAEAIKEFAAKIKGDAEWICDDSYIEDALTEYIDNLVKEMVGDV